MILLTLQPEVTIAVGNRPGSATENIRELCAYKYMKYMYL